MFQMREMISLLHFKSPISLYFTESFSCLRWLFSKSLGLYVELQFFCAVFSFGLGIYLLRTLRSFCFPGWFDWEVVVGCCCFLLNQRVWFVCQLLVCVTDMLPISSRDELLYWLKSSNFIVFQSEIPNSFEIRMFVELFQVLF